MPVQLNLGLCQDDLIEVVCVRETCDTKIDRIYCLSVL